MMTAIAIALVAMIVLPMTVKVIDEQLGYFYLSIGGVMLWYAMSKGLVTYEHGAFLQSQLKGDEEHLAHMLGEPAVLLGVFGGLQVFAYLLRRQIESAIQAALRRLPAHVMVGLWTLLVGSCGAVSVVVMAALGVTFFKSLKAATKRDYTSAAVAFSGNIGISALLLTIGEPLSLFIAKNLGVDSGYLLRTFAGVVMVNSVVLTLAAFWFAKRAPVVEESIDEAATREMREAVAAVHGPVVADKEVKREVDEAAEALKKLQKEEHGFAHELDKILHATAKLAFFVYGLLLFGVAVKSTVASTLSNVPSGAMFWANSISAVADNALLGLLEVTKGMDQNTVLALGLSLALWGVGLVPGNVCNVVLKEGLGISFRRWARTGMPLAIALACFNFLLIKTGIADLLIVVAR